jgi:hypothetical protein
VLDNSLTGSTSYKLVSLGGFDVRPSNSVRELGTYIDAAVSMQSHIDLIVAR